MFSLHSSNFVRNFSTKDQPSRDTREHHVRGARSPRRGEFSGATWHSPSGSAISPNHWLVSDSTSATAGQLCTCAILPLARHIPAAQPLTVTHCAPVHRMPQPANPARHPLPATDQATTCLTNARRASPWRLSRVPSLCHYKKGCAIPSAPFIPSAARHCRHPMEPLPPVIPTAT